MNFRYVVPLILVLAAPSFAQSDDDRSPAGYVEMPEATDGTYTLSSGVGSGRHWGTPDLIRFLVFAAREWARRHPDGPRLHLGDMSKPDASEFPPHKTHRDGLTLDLYTKPKNICHKDYPEQDLTQELAELLVELGANQILYNGAQVIAAVPVVREYPNHDDHFHVVIDPNRVPSDLGPLLVAPTGRKNGGALGPSAFGKPGVRTRRSKKESDAFVGEELRIEWDVLGEARGFPKTVRVQVEVVSGDGWTYDSGEIKTRNTYHLVPGEFFHGKRLRWQVEATDSKGEVQTTGWHQVTIDCEPPVLNPKAPAAGETVAAKPTFTWDFEDISKQARARAEVRRPRTRGFLIAGEVRGDAREIEANIELPKGRQLEWRVVGTDQAGNEAESEWTSFQID